MSKKLLSELPALIEAGILSEDTAQQIRDFYLDKKDHSSNRLFIVFGVLGALLVGLGIMLIVAHNWDELSRTSKTTLAFLPLLMGQAACGYVLFQKMESSAWRESSVTFLTFAIGASIALISQIYNIPGNFSAYMLTWVVLVLPMIYIFRSSMASLLCIAGITIYACEVGYSFSSQSSAPIYWAVLLAILPHYYWLFQNRPRGNFMLLHHWLIPLSVLICLGTIIQFQEEWMLLAYFSLLGGFYLIGKFPFFQNQKLLFNSYLVIGSIGSIILLLILSFMGFWEEWSLEFKVGIGWVSPEFWTAVILTIASGVLLLQNLKKEHSKEIEPIRFAFLIAIIFLTVGKFFPVLSTILINILVFFIGVTTIQKGGNANHLGILNYGLLIITILIICRFFDLDLTFVFRGVLFVLVGIGFFVANYRMFQKRKSS